MVLTRYAIALLASSALLTAPAFAGIGVSVGAGAGAHVGTPSIGTPNIGTPNVGAPPIGTRQPISAPPVSVPRANTDASARANASADVSAGLPLQGTLAALNGNTATIRLPSGAMHAYKVSTETARALKSAVGKPITFVARNDALALVQHGTLTAVNGTSAVVKLAEGATRTFSIGAADSAWLKSHVGKRITFWTDTNGSLQLDRGASSNAATK